MAKTDIRQWACWTQMKDPDEEDHYDSELMKQIREHRLAQFRPSVILRKKNGEEIRR
jgi:hypothetical protein